MTIDTKKLSRVAGPVVAVLALFAGRARADAVPGEPADCPVGSVGVTSHCGAFCSALACLNDGDCPDGTACMPTTACIRLDDCVSPEFAQVHGGPCSRDATCTGEGESCKSLKLCLPGDSTSSDDGGNSTAGSTGAATTGAATTGAATTGTTTGAATTGGATTGGATTGGATTGGATTGGATTGTGATSDATPTTGQPGTSSTGASTTGSAGGSTGGTSGGAGTDPKGGCGSCAVGDGPGGALGLLALLGLVRRRRGRPRWPSPCQAAS